ncbi:hypothetical protein ACK3TF_003556 [Chlorella vulgaris]
MQGAFADQENDGTLGQQAMQLGPSFCETAARGPRANDWQPSWAARGGQPLRLDVRHTPLGSGTELGAPPVSCPSRLQHSSPARDGSGACLFDPFASSQDDPPGLTPLGARQAAAAPRAAPPAVQRKPAAECSPGPAPPPPPAAPSFAGRVQSCPPERLGRRGARPLVRLRVKRSLNGAVAAAGGPSLARRSLDAGSVAAAALAAAPQLAGCSRKRLDAELLSPPVPRKNSRTLLDEAAAAELMMGRLQLAASGGSSGSGSNDGSAGATTGSEAAAPVLMNWDAVLSLSVLPTQEGGSGHAAGG